MNAGFKQLKERLARPGHGLDHQRWPNRFFAELGLFSLVTAPVSACQFSRR